MQNLLFIFLGLTFLILGGSWLLKSAVALSLRLNIPKIVIGMTVVSFATSAPELIVSIKAALNGFPDLALGNVIGSNIANLGLVLAITIILGSIDVRKSFYTTDWPVMMVASLLFYFFIKFDGELQQHEGVIMVVALFVFLEDKKFVDHVAFGNTHRYFPIVSKESYRKKFINSTISDYYAN